MYITRCNYYGIMRSSLGKILQEILTNCNNVSFLNSHSNFENSHFDFNGVIDYTIENNTKTIEAYKSLKTDANGAH